LIRKSKLMHPGNSGHKLKTTERVSVLVTAKDAERTIGTAIQFILRSLRRDDELLILADGCSDGTEAVARSFRDNRVRVFTVEKSLGRGAGRNFLAHRATGGILAVNDADDLCLPWRIRCASKEVLSHPMIFGTALILLDKFKIPLIFPQVPLGVEGDAVLKNLLVRNPFVHSTMMIKRDLFLQVGGYRMDEGEDYDLYLRVAQLGVPIRRLWIPMVVYRVHAGQATAAHDFESRVQQNPKILTQVLKLSKLVFPNLTIEEAKSLVRSSLMNGSCLTRLDFVGYKGSFRSFRRRKLFEGDK
jgi:glycosyltransferase involved in cell wall biosynthesis